MADAMLTELEVAEAELSVLLTNDATIRRLNRDHRGQDKSTDVLAFAQDSEHPLSPLAGPALLGDVVISLETAARQAAARKRELLHEVRFLLAHGLLHLAGYDHDRPETKRVMTAMTRKLVRRAG